MVNAQKTEEPDVIMTDSSIQILDPVSQVPDSLKREKAKDTNIILESFSNMEKIDVDYKKIEEFVKKNPKGYKDLMKMFHPDNVSGDSYMVQLINQEYSALCRRYDVGMKA